jgi:hypothetical protein
MLTYFVHRSNAVPDRAAAFLDVSSLNLAVPHGTAFFLQLREAAAFRIAAEET